MNEKFKNVASLIYRPLQIYEEKKLTINQSCEAQNKVFSSHITHKQIHKCKALELRSAENVHSSFKWET